VQIEQAGLPNAIHVGRKSVKCEFFGFLDDDDYLLPGAILLRENYLREHNDIDVIVTNGYRHGLNTDCQIFRDTDALARIQTDPLASLLKGNWLTSCGALYRTASVLPEIFYKLTRYAEWTDVAFRLIDVHKFDFLFDNTYAVSDSPGSLSKDSGQARHMVELHTTFATKLKTPLQRQLLNKKICALYHQLADMELADNHRLAALRYHLKSMFYAPMVGVPKYLLYTRKLIIPRLFF
jgi:hypothetical protein